MFRRHRRLWDKLFGDKETYKPNKLDINCSHAQSLFEKEKRRTENINFQSAFFLSQKTTYCLAALFTLPESAVKFASVKSSKRLIKISLTLKTFRLEKTRSR